MARVLFRYLTVKLDIFWLNFVEAETTVMNYGLC